ARFLAIGGRIWDLAACKEVATLFRFGDAGWAVVAPNGAFDTSDLDAPPLHWVHEDDPMHAIPLEVFMRQYYTPRLLTRLLNGQPMPSVASIANLNWQRPQLEIKTAEPDPAHPGKIRVRIALAQTEGPLGKSGAKDLRLFRDGQLVRFDERTLTDG